MNGKGYGDFWFRRAFWGWTGNWREVEVQQLAPRCFCQAEPLTNEPLSRQAPGEKLLPRGSDSDLGAPLRKEALDREKEVKIRTQHGWGEGS